MKLDVLIPEWLISAGRTPCYGQGELFTGETMRIGKARALCGRCPVRRECGQWAISQGEVDGVWGGMSPRDRRRRARVRARALLERPECGTPRARRWHRDRGETCTRCADAHALELRTTRVLKLVREHAEHGGSLAGYRLELLLDLETCELCRAARREYYRDYYAARKEEWQGSSAESAPTARLPDPLREFGSLREVEEKARAG